MSNYPKLHKNVEIDPDITNSVFPVQRALVYHNGVIKLERGCLLQGRLSDHNGRKDRKIKMLSNKSLALLTATIQATDVRLTTMLTMTYPRLYPRNGKEVKKMLRAVLQHFRNNGSLEYLWFLEFQLRGAPHIHLLTNHDGISPHMRISFAHTWVGLIKDSDWFQDAIIVKAVSECKCEYEQAAQQLKNAFVVAAHRETWQWIRKPDGAKRYVTAYATKPEQKEVPLAYRDVGRFWGCSRGVILKDPTVIGTTEGEFRAFLLAQSHPAAEKDILPKYISGVKYT